MSEAHYLEEKHREKKLSSCRPGIVRSRFKTFEELGPFRSQVKYIAVKYLCKSRKTITHPTCTFLRAATFHIPSMSCVPLIGQRHQQRAESKPLI